jgi:hypothetical protein
MASASKQSRRSARVVLEPGLNDLQVECKGDQALLSAVMEVALQAPAL